MKVCEFCGKKFFSSSYKQRFCSRKCSGERLGVSWRGKTFEERYGIEKARELRKNMNKTKKGLKCTVETREKIRKALKGKKHPWAKGIKHPWWAGEKNPNKKPEAREKISKAKKKLWEDPKYREKSIKILNRPEVKEKLRISSTERWKNPSYVKNFVEKNHLQPNKLEIHFKNLLDKHFPSQFRYTGDLSLNIGGRFPDFVHASEKKVIELFGDYWHEGENPQELINHYKKHGYDCLVVWEHEFWKERERVKDKILSFNEDLKLNEQLSVEVKK